ncbi:hypothetical protein [Flavihumibacter solisilvae]|uniref:Lipoprotein n=1 Tax=Flavihumibacter solisilvae TaxID=1349421 RepID=A0A0C1ITC8_9BACT|nr:hypothetical protein [Flavihumibacter solisilvae]KIC93694.1 hypothetical protein OI18_16190 [Flavihumibacter solisilvae]
MKKILAFILFSVIAIAVFTPCCTDDCQENATTQQEAAKKNLEGNCSPFFACGGCHGFAPAISIIHVSTPPGALREYFIIDHSTTFPPHADIPWQPPRNA